MAVRISTDKIQNLQQLEAVVSGPDDANRLFIIDGQFEGSVLATSVSSAGVAGKETFTALIGPVLKKRQFLQANATASFARTTFTNDGVPSGTMRATWAILGVDADWDDESGQVELRIEALVTSQSLAQQSIGVAGFAFHVTVLAAIAP